MADTPASPWCVDPLYYTSPLIFREFSGSHQKIYSQLVFVHMVAIQNGWVKIALKFIQFFYHSVGLQETNPIWSYRVAHYFGYSPHILYRKWIPNPPCCNLPNPMPKPQRYRGPEVVLEVGWDHKSETWSRNRWRKIGFSRGHERTHPCFRRGSKNPANGEFTGQLGVHPFLDGDGRGESDECWVEFLQNCPWSLGSGVIFHDLPVTGAKTCFELEFWGELPKKPSER